MSEAPKLPRQATVKLLTASTEKEQKETWLSRYGLAIRLNMFINLIFLPLIIMIDTSLIDTLNQAIGTCIISLLIMFTIIITNIDNNHISTRGQYEIIVGMPYFLLILYFIMQNIFLSKNNEFDVFIFLLFYLCLLLGTGVFGYLRYSHSKMFDTVLLLIWNILAILKLINIIDNSEKNNHLSFDQYVLANFVLLFAKVKSSCSFNHVAVLSPPFVFFDFFLVIKKIVCFCLCFFVWCV